MTYEEAVRSARAPLQDAPRNRELVRFASLAAAAPRTGDALMIAKIIKAAGLYFLIVFGTGFLLGPIRVLWLEPRIGTLAAVLCEAPFLLAAIFVGSRLAPRAVRIEPRTDMLLAVGTAALAMQQTADVTVGLALRDLALRDQLAQFASAEGAVYAALLILFAVMPSLANRNPR
ncbi:MAG: hypothetical protein HY852_01895 [Bradyrhizobium sp.]|uniref:hypothetical protein n=1 Tax=Bradyrhizobium sp. TaxID=376 RepID=UPI0025C0CFD7|nr:hypothetical protein [Bradyrhizobium sp.]MBI5260552.1 hypothetical protein [Bradyrhizobium sp.]